MPIERTICDRDIGHATLSRGLATFAFQFRLGQRHVVYGTGEWIDDHLGREPVIVFASFTAELAELDRVAQEATKPAQQNRTPIPIRGTSGWVPAG